MNKNKFLFSAEDENDFMPIIAINEREGEEEKIVIPDTLPLLPLRNTVLFPGVVLPITVGRDKSIKAVNEAYKNDKLIGVLAQNDTEVEDPAVKDLCKIGTVAKILKLIKMPDGGTTIIIQGKKRFELMQVIAEEPFFKAQIQLLEDQPVNFSALILMFSRDNNSCFSVIEVFKLLLTKLMRKEGFSIFFKMIEASVGKLGDN